jgi:hypothetical protein
MSQCLPSASSQIQLGRNTVTTKTINSKSRVLERIFPECPAAPQRNGARLDGVPLRDLVNDAGYW